jgi:hypothetical protein
MRFVRWTLAAFSAAILCGNALAEAIVDDASLRDRVARFWAAEVRQDYVAVHALLSADEQRRSSRDEYVAIRTHKGPFRYLRADVVEVDGERDLAWVHVKFDWTTPRVAALRSTGETWQLWRYQDGWFPVPGTDRELWPKLPPKLRPRAEEVALKERVQRLWNAKVAEDWRGVYEYMPPDWRQRMPLEQFLRSKARFVYSTPVVEWVEIGELGDARARVSFGQRLNDPAISKMKPQPTSLIEPWIKVDGTWYLNLFVLDPPPAAAQVSPSEIQ